jgi:hypothetical protein
LGENKKFYGSKDLEFSYTEHKFNLIGDALEQCYKKFFGGLEDIFSKLPANDNPTINPFYVTVIEYHGLGITYPGKKDVLAMIPEKPAFGNGQFRMRYINWDDWAMKFAQKSGRITFIFNHASTLDPSTLQDGVNGKVTYDDLN